MCSSLFADYTSLKLEGGEGTGWEKWKEEEQWRPAGDLGNTHTTHTHTH